MIDWYAILVGIGLSIGGFIFGLIWLRVSGEAKFSFLMLILIVVFASICFLFGIYSIIVGLGLL